MLHKSGRSRKNNIRNSKKRLKEGPNPTIEDKIIKSSKRGFQFTGEIKTIKSVKS